MKKKLNRLIALFLMSTIAAGSGFTAVAAEDTTEAAENETVNTAENDRWYQEAIGFLAYLGIFTGDENGNMNPESDVTRAEIAAIILREMNITDMNTYNDTFSDVDDGHWAADIIQTAYDNGIINGYDDGTFGPDEDVTYEQAVKMVMCAINYEDYAKPYGGYPDGYLKIANDEDITDHVSGKVGEAITRRNIAKLVYNSLTAPYPVATGVSSGNIEYTKSSDVTILSELRDMYYLEGTITAAPGKSIDLSMEIKQQQIGFEGQLIDSEIQNPEQYVAQYVRLFYYDPDGHGSDRTAVYAVPLTNKTEEITVNAKDIDEITTGYTGSDVSQIVYCPESNSSKTKKIKLTEQPIIVYNDQPFTLAHFSLLGASNSDGSAMSFDEFITPEEGSVRAVDFGKDGTYDILFVESYETSVVKLATALRLQLDYPISVGSILKLDTSSDSSLNVTVIRDEEPATLRDLKEGDVVSIRMNANFTDDMYTGDKYITIDASFDYFDGTVNSINSDENGYHAVIDGKEYDIVDNEDVFDDVKALLNSTGKFYINKFGTIANVDGKITGGLGSGEKYGWLVNVFSDGSEEDVVARIYTQDGTMEDIPVAGKVDYWAPDASSNVQVTAAEIDALINNTAEGSKYFVNCTAIDETEKVSIRICKYKTNSSGQLNRLYIAVDENTVSEKSGAVRVVTTDFKESHQSSGLFAGKYVIENSIPQMTVPLSYSDMSDIDNYGYRMINSSEFSKTVGENELGYNCFFVDVSDYAPGIVIRMQKSITESMSIDEYSTADDNPVIVVSSINEAVNDNDDIVYIIKGYRDGKAVEYTTARNVIAAQVTPTVRKDKETYDTVTLWTQDSDEKLTDIIHPGDICGIDGSMSNVGVVLRMVDARGLADHLVGGGAPGTVQSGQFRFDELFSPTRDRVIFGYVTDTATTPIVQYTIAVDGSESADDDGDVASDGSTLVTVGVADLSRAVYFVNISKSGKITVDKDVSDAFEVEPGDYVFMRSFKDDASRELYVIRYNK